MRLGLLGPSGGDITALGRAAEFLLNGAKVHRAIYLGADGALDRAVAAWARKLVGDDPTDDAAWRRAAQVAASGTWEQVDKFVATERSRVRLKALEALPESVARTVEMISDRVAVLIYDKGLLDEEEDILAANILCFGKNDGPLVKKIGTRWFVSPGPIGSAGGGMAVLDDEADDVVITIYDGTGKATTREVLSQTRTAKMRVQGDA
jgi:hypothetical protein